jgi:Flp pilus assembly protein TadD
MAQTENAMQKWLDGQISLGAAARWDKDEIRIISEIAYSLAQQGRNQESILLFEGLIAVAPATAYFQSALGALHLRTSNFAQAIERFDAALRIEPNDIIALVNRGESYIKTGNIPEGRKDLEKALDVAKRLPAKQYDINDETQLTVKRARALLQVYKQIA